MQLIQFSALNSSLMCTTTHLIFSNHQVFPWYAYSRLKHPSRERNTYVYLCKFNFIVVDIEVFWNYFEGSLHKGMIIYKQPSHILVQLYAEKGRMLSRRNDDKNVKRWIW